MRCAGCAGQLADLPSGPVELSACPYRAGFAQEEWILRCLRWGLDAHSPAWLQEGVEHVELAREHFRRRDLARARAMNAWQR